MFARGSSRLALPAVKHVCCMKRRRFTASEHIQHNILKHMESNAAGHLGNNQKKYFRKSQIILTLISDFRNSSSFWLTLIASDTRLLQFRPTSVCSPTAAVCAWLFVCILNEKNRFSFTAVGEVFRILFGKHVCCQLPEWQHRWTTEMWKLKCSLTTKNTTRTGNMQTKKQTYLFPLAIWHVRHIEWQPSVQYAAYSLRRPNVCYANFWHHHTGVA